MCGSTCSHKMSKKEAKALDTRINAVCQKVCHGIQIKMMDLGKLSNATREYIAAAPYSDEDLIKMVRAFALTLPGCKSTI